MRSKSGGLLARFSNELELSFSLVDSAGGTSPSLLFKVMSCDLVGVAGVEVLGVEL